MRLYEMSGAIAAIEDAIIDADGELTDEIAAQLDAIEGTFESKVEACAFAIRNMETLADAAKIEETRIASLRKSRESGARRLKGYLQTCMEIACREKVETAAFKIALQKSPPSVVVDCDPSDLPSEYIRVIPESYEVDRKAIIADYKAGASLPAGVSVHDSYHLRIR